MKPSIRQKLARIIGPQGENDVRRSLIAILAVAAIIVVITATIIEWRRCDGELVRGVIWWTCVERAP